MVSNINANPRDRKATKRGRKPLFDAAISKERFYAVERVFGWEDKFRRLLLRFEHLSQLHYTFKTLAYTMINMRHFCQNKPNVRPPTIMRARGDFSCPYVDGMSAQDAQYQSIIARNQESCEFALSIVLSVRAPKINNPQPVVCKGGEGPNLPLPCSSALKLLI
jgi:hypothetical protein